MKLGKIKVQNFRLLKDSTLDLDSNMSLVIGRNNTGKTSLLSLIEKFYKGGNPFNFDDFPISLRPILSNINENTDIDDLSIRLIMEIQYDENDNLDKLSEFIIDLDESQKSVNILFESKINKELLIKDISTITVNDEKETYVKKNLADYILPIKVFTFRNENDLKSENRDKLIEKSLSDFKNIVNIEIIHANRNLFSSESNNKRKVLSGLAKDFYTTCGKTDHPEFLKLESLIKAIDDSLTGDYEGVFKSFLGEAEEFLDFKDLSLKVISEIKAESLLENASKVVYGSDTDNLPENLNGLGYMNILYLLLTVQMKKIKFANDNKDLNLLLIEEPEAHTHPQMQYVFANKIQKYFKYEENGNLNIQGIITTHSPYIVAKSDFDNLRYMKKESESESGDNITIKNFCLELNKKYGEDRKQEFIFLTKYLNTQAAELFFAKKIIFIEGISEKILLPYFIEKVDSGSTQSNKLNSQNISILEVGANAKAFDEFLKFFDIKTLIITDIDTTKKEISNKNGNEKIVYKSSPVIGCSHTSNETLKYFLDAPKDINTTEWDEWIKKLIKHELEIINDKIDISYQQIEDDYHARSFEDAFISINKSNILENKDNISGLKNIDDITQENLNSDKLFELTKDIIQGKADFAASILYLILSEQADFQIPLYIKEGLTWLAQD